MGTEKRQRQKQNTLNARAERQRMVKRRMWRDRTFRYGGGIVVAVVVVVLIAQLQGGSSTSSDTTSPTNTSPSTTVAPDGRSITGVTPCPATDGSEERATKFEQEPSMCIDPNKSYVATFDTSEGVIKVNSMRRRHRRR